MNYIFYVPIRADLIRIDVFLFFLILFKCMIDKYLKFIDRHPRLVVFIILLITFFFAYHAIHIQIVGDYSMFLPSGEAPEVYQGGNRGEEDLNSIALAYDVSLNDSLDQTLYTTVLPPNNLIASSGTNDATGLIEQSEPDYNYGASYLVLVEADDIYQADVLNAFEISIRNLVARREVGVPSSVFDFVTLGSSGKRLLTIPITNHEYGDASWTDEEAQELKKRITSDPNLKYYLVSADGNSILFDFPIGGINNSMLDEFKAEFQPFIDEGGRVYTNGGAVINAKVMEYLQKDLVTLVSLCLIVILIVFYLCFRSKRSVLIPASLSVIGLIWTFGTMEMLGIQLTLLNIVTPCMVLTLGSAYSIHVINEYYSSIAKNRDISPAFAVKKVLKTIFLACITTICGFLCLVVSQTSGLRDFGYSVSVGILYCAILAATYLPAILSIIPVPSVAKIQKQKTGIMAKCINKIAVFVPKHWVFLIILSFVVCCYGFIVKNSISLDSNYMSYFPESDPFGNESRHFAEKIGGTNPFYVTITVPDDQKQFFIDSDNLGKVWQFQDTITKESNDILQILSFPSYVSFANTLVNGEEGVPATKGLAMLLSRLIILMQNQVGGQLSMILNQDATKLTLVIQHWDSEKQDLMTTSSISRVRDVIINNLDLLPEGTEVTISGDPIINLKFVTRLLEDQNLSTILSILIVFIIASIAFRSVFKGIYAVIPVLCGICINYLFMYFASIPFDIITVSFSSIAVGCGVDDAIHFILRYKGLRKENPNENISLLLTDTLHMTGRPIILTTLSVVMGMMMLSFGSYTPIRYFGLLMSVTLMGCMISTIFILPTFIILGDRITAFCKRIKCRS